MAHDFEGVGSAKCFGITNACKDADAIRQPCGNSPTSDRSLRKQSEASSAQTAMCVATSADAALQRGIIRTPDSSDSGPGR
ncbi:MAG: hypothetical protein KKD27_16825, partial [Gammaproteobacteria bacterium]|nr:hypothetical protein [Gammaproteobacteria bacterium]